MNRTPPTFLTLVLLAAAAPLTLNMFLPSLTAIANDFETSYQTVSLALSGYMILTAAVQLVLGPLSDRYGRRPVLLSALAVYALAAVGAALAQDVTTFLVCRVLQGGMAAGYAIAMAIVRDMHGPNAAASRLGYISMTMAIVPMLGPVFGGMLDTLFGWRASFWTFSVIGSVLFVVTWFDLGETRSAHVSPSRGITALLGNDRFWAFTLCSVFSTGGFYVFIAGAPLVAQTTFGLSSEALGVVIGSITLGFLTGSYLSGRFSTRFQLTTMMVIGRCVAVAGVFFGLMVVLFDVLAPIPYFASTLAVGLGNGLSVPSSNAGAMSVDPSRSGGAAGISGAATLAIGAGLTMLSAWAVDGPFGARSLLLVLLGTALSGLTAALWARFRGGDGVAGTPANG